jgi:hypothetical protein
MRKPSVADESVRAEREAVLALSPTQRVALALRLGARSLASYASRKGIELPAARRELERQRQSQRRPSACIEALLE